MAKYFTNPYGKIYSDFAYRLGVVVQQYELLNLDSSNCELDDTNKYESTLYICVLQSLLTQFAEVKKWAANKKSSKDFDLKPVWDEDISYWRIEVSSIKISEGEDLTIGYLLGQIRHVLSHPLPVSDGMEYDTENENGMIVKYNFRRRDHGNLTFSATFSSSALKELIAKLSEYLSGSTKKIATELAKTAAD